MDLVNFFKGLGDETRLRIVNLLLHRSPLRVMDLVSILNIPQSTISRHLAQLKNAGWVTDRRVDRWVYYRLRSELDESFLSALKLLLQRSLILQNDVQAMKSQPYV